MAPRVPAAQGVEQPSGNHLLAPRPNLKGGDMFVTVLHHITDPEGFEAAEAKAIEAGLPPNIALPIHAATPDHRTGVCIWEGESVDAVRELVESVVGPFSSNEYFEMNVDGLAPALV